MPTLRPLRLPDDLDLWISLVRDGFVYPENPAWNTEADEIESALDTLRTAKRLWPLIALLMRVSADVRDTVHGRLAYVDDQPAGCVIYQRRRGGREWVISDVMVLPPFRRRGLARALVQAALEDIRARGGTQAVLDVIDGNLPAQKLYLSLGFEHYSGAVEFSYEALAAARPLPGGYTHASVPRADWRTRFAFAERIVPAAVARFTPVTEGNFRQPAAIRWVFGLLARASGELTRTYAVRAAGGEAVLGVGTLTARTRKGGVNKLAASADPAEPAAAPYLLSLLLNEIAALSQGQRVVFEAPIWQPALLSAAASLGAVQKYQLQRMGLRLMA